MIFNYPCATLNCTYMASILNCCPIPLGFKEISMLSLRRFFLTAGLMVSTASIAQVESQERHPNSSPSALVSATTECRAGCHGNTAGCQESYETAVLVASPGMRLYASTVIASKSWPGSDTTGLVREPEWDKKSEPPDDPRPISIRVKPFLNSCEGRNGDKQSRTHYLFTAVQGP